MNIEISASETFLTQEEREYIRRRLENALSENETDIERVQVWMVGIVLADADEAQYCLINAKLTDGSLVACDGTHTMLKTALNHAVERVSREVTRILRQRRKQSVGHIPNSAGSYRNTTNTGQMPNRLPSNTHLESVRPPSA
jgi:ribosome-associated translation inhibitor RaiA